MTYSTEEMIEAENRLRYEKNYRKALPLLRHSNSLRFIISYHDGVFKMHRYSHLFNIGSLRSEIYYHLRRCSHIKPYLENARLNKFTTKLNDKITLKVLMSDVSINKFRTFKTKPKDDIDIEVHWTAKPMFNVCAQVKLIIDPDYLKANMESDKEGSAEDEKKSDGEGTVDTNLSDAETIEI